MKNLLVLFWFILCGTGVLIAQDLLFNYNFDDCTFEENSAIFPGITPGGNPKCVCGIGDKGFSLDGINDFLKLSSQANPYFDNNFTLDIYFKLENIPGETDIFSHRSSCNSLDSLMALRYFSSTNELLFEIGSNVGNYHSVRSILNKDFCWHRFTLVKFGLEYQVYVDNILIKKILVRENIYVPKNGNLTFANSPCNIVNQANKMKGIIDEITLYTRAYSEVEVKKLYKYPDRIITPNTTIFKGSSIKLQSGPSCASTYRWTPVNTLQFPSSSEPLATPEENTTYRLTLDNGNCISTDTVRIFVADKDKLDCDNLLLPKAFTPNNDGLNDRYGISNTFLVESIDYFEIYDRWGAKVWETREINDLWDGSVNGQPLNSGTYIYKIKYYCSGKEKLNINNFLLIR